MEQTLPAVGAPVEPTVRPDPERAAFEAWLNPGHHAGNVSAWVEPGRYEKDTHSLAWLAWKAAVTSERERIAALIAQHSGLTLETLEYLETMRQGPTAEEWADLDRAARA